jgi:hypothetical protein
MQSNRRLPVVDTDTGEFIERTLSHEGNVVRESYAVLEERCERFS